MKRLLAGAGGVAIVALAVPTAASVASAQAQTCTNKTVVQDHITKTDNGHGTPSEWADLSMNRTTTICGDEKAGYDVKLVDKGSLWTRPGAGSPNGVGGQILNRVPGKVYGLYTLHATGGKLVNHHGDTSLSSTEYVKSLFASGTTVTGGPYAWGYATRCEPKGWLDSSTNNDGQGAAAGNITGKRCGKPTPTPSSSDTATPTPSPTTSTPPGEAPVPTPVNSDLPVTG